MVTSEGASFGDRMHARRGLSSFRSSLDLHRAKESMTNVNARRMSDSCSIDASRVALLHAAYFWSTKEFHAICRKQAHRLFRCLYEIPYSLNAGGGLLTTADEMARWVIALLKGRLMKADQLDGMWAPEKLNNGADGAWSAGWPVHTE